MKERWKNLFTGFIAGILMMLMLIGLLNVHSGKEEQTIEKQQEEECVRENLGEQEGADEQRETDFVNEEAIQENTEEETDGYYISAHMQIPTYFTKKILLYNYIEYGVRKYNEENEQTTIYSCDMEEDMLSFDTEFCMTDADKKPYKTDLAKVMIPELSNNIYNFRLTSESDTIYMSIDTYNMKIYVYDAIVK